MRLVALLVWIGLVRVRDDGTIRWPFHCMRWWTWKARWWPAVGEREPIVGVFRNRRGVIKWERGRLLPRRWGVWILGLEFGDRG
jgi:hypothetical protein